MKKEKWKHTHLSVVQKYRITVKEGTFSNLCYKHAFFLGLLLTFHNSPYLCIVFFIVLDLRLTKVGARRCSFLCLYA